MTTPLTHRKWPQPTDITGKRLDRLVVLKPEPREPGAPLKWSCQCDCGAVVVKGHDYLLTKHKKHCGRSCPLWFAIKHGGRESPEYGVWGKMRARCNDPKARGYERYGGRGIRVCDRWESSFADFLADMGNRPSPDHQIDRIDNDGNYEPGNCRWATPKENSRNKRNNLVITIDGRSQAFAAWCEEVGVKPDAMYSRAVSHGTTAEEEIRRVIRTGETCLVPHADPQTLAAAIAAVEGGESLRSASERFGISRGTIQKHRRRAGLGPAGWATEPLS